MTDNILSNEEIKFFISSHPNPMEVMCKTCKQPYGKHAGMSCKIGAKQFYPVIDGADMYNPNIQFKMRKER